MAKSEFKSVDEYIASQPEAIQGALARVRTAIRKALPDAEEVISYKMPTYKLNGKPALHLAAWKRHYSLYAATAGVVIAFKRELAPYDVIQGTIRLPLSQPVPVALIERIAKFRAKEVTQRAKEKAAQPKKRLAAL
ncbi:MAG: iron chaperone [Terriglobales bacterium]